MAISTDLYRVGSGFRGCYVIDTAAYVFGVYRMPVAHSHIVDIHIFMSGGLKGTVCKWLRITPERATPAFTVLHSPFAY